MGGEAVDLVQVQGALRGVAAADAAGPNCAAAAAVAAGSAAVAAAVAVSCRFYAATIFERTGGIYRIQ